MPPRRLMAYDQWNEFSQLVYFITNGHSTDVRLGFRGNEIKLLPMINRSLDNHKLGYHS